MDLRKKLLYKMLVKYYLGDKINVSFEDFALVSETFGPTLHPAGTM